MARIAILADIHGNIPALEAVLDDIARRRLDEVLVGGDLVGRGPEGGAVVRRVRAAGLRSVRGNHEEYLLDFRTGRANPAWMKSPDWVSARWMAAELAQDEADFIDALPPALTAISAPELRLVHGTPRSNREGVGPWTSDALLAEIAALGDERVLVCAHTHRPMARSINDTYVVNVGSVGLPFSGDPRAHYVIFEGEGDRWRSEPVLVPYDREETLARYRSTGFLEAGGVVARLLAAELRTARSHLVPFLQWIDAVGRPHDEVSLADFLARYEPEGSLRAFLRQERAAIGQRE